MLKARRKNRVIRIPDEKADEYKKLERELDLLEDKLDDAEDRLEYIFGIDD